MLQFEREWDREGKKRDNRVQRVNTGAETENDRQPMRNREIENVIKREREWKTENE